MKRHDNPTADALHMRKVIARRKREGRCNGCEKILTDPDFKSCRRCRKRNAKASARKRKRQPDYEKKNYIWAVKTRLRSKFNMTLEEYQGKLDKQSGKCAICFRTQDENVRRAMFAVDHCHMTKDNRGLLCDYCNRALGQMGDDSARLRRAADYLDSYQEEKNND
jgi:Recombination endonuclease VII